MNRKIGKIATAVVLLLLVGVSAQETNLEQSKVITVPEGVTLMLNDLAVRENGRIKVSGTLGYWNNTGDMGQGDLTRSREAAFDGNEDTFFDPRTAENLVGNCWTGIEFDRPYYVMKIRYKGRKGGNSGQLGQMKGCKFQGANLPDFSDAEDIAIANPSVDAVGNAENGWKTWNGVNYWGEIDVPFVCSSSDPFSSVARRRGAYRYLRIIGPNPYIKGTDQSGMCCGNIGELEFYGLPEAMANTQDGYDAEEYRPEISGQQTGGGAMTFDMTFKFMPREINPEEVVGTLTPQSLYGYEVFRQTPMADHSGYNSELVEGGFMMAYPGRESVTYSFSDPSMMPRVRYLVRSFNIMDNSLEATYLTPAFSVFPIDIRVTGSEGGGSAMIRWGNENVDASAVAGVNVFRGTAPGGPWTKLNETPVTYTAGEYEDDTLLGGIVYYYHLVYAFNDPFGGETYDGPQSPEVSYRYEENIERLWNADGTSQLKPGMEAICHYQSWDASGGPGNLFDNNYSTFSDIVPKSDRTIRDDGTAKAGVDLGAAYVITRARIYPRTNSERYRFSKLALFGSNADSTGRDNADGWRDNANCTQLTPRFQEPSPFASFYEVEITDPTPYRYVFIQHAEYTAADRNKEAFANAAELQLFGYPANSQGANVLLAPTSVMATVLTDSANAYGKTGVEITWNASPNAESYQIYHKADGSDEWVVLATGLTQTSYFHEVVALENLGAFRVGSVRENSEQAGVNEYAYSRDSRPYALGNGTGLWAVYTCPYEINIPKRKEWIKRVDATIDNTWGSQKIIPECDESTNDVHVVWSGKLIAPATGVYQFRVNCNDAFALRIDSTQVINNWDGNKSDPALYRGEVYLEAGEHKIRADYHTMQAGEVPDMFCNLEWGGAVNEGPIPSSQLIPEPLPPMSYPWMGESTFEAKTKGYSEFAPTIEKVLEVGEDGIEREVEKSIDGFIISGAGDDFWIKETAAHMVWRMVTGNFLISAKFERRINAKPGMDNDSGWAWKGMLVARKDLGLVPPVVCACFASNGFAGRADLKIRDQKGGDIYDYEARRYDLPAVVYQKLQRVGNVFTQSFSEDGENWEVVKTYVDEAGMMDGVLYVGPAVSSILNLRELGTYRVTVVKVESDSGSGIVYVR